MKRRKKEEELNIIASGDLILISEAIKEYAFTVGTQLALLAPEHRPVLQVYLAMRKPCKNFVREVLAGNYEQSIIEASIVGNCLDEENEILLVERYPQMVERYTTENPNGPYLHDAAYQLALENEELADKVQEYPHQEATISMGDMFSPEMLAKLGL